MRCIFITMVTMIMSNAEENYDLLPHTILICQCMCSNFMSLQGLGEEGRRALLLNSLTINSGSKNLIIHTWSFGMHRIKIAYFILKYWLYLNDILKAHVSSIKYKTPWNDNNKWNTKTRNFKGAHNAAREGWHRIIIMWSWTLNYVGDCVNTHAMKSLNSKVDLEVELTDATTMMHGCTTEWTSTVCGWITKLDSLPHSFFVSLSMVETFLSYNKKFIRVKKCLSHQHKILTYGTWCLQT